MKSVRKIISILTICGGFLFATESFANDIIRYRVISETPDEIVMEVEYFYSGNFGENVAIGAYMANDGKRSEYFAYVPGNVVRGQHKTQVTLSKSSKAPKQFITNQILLSMYIGGGRSFLDEFFPYRKTWGKIERLPAPVMISPPNRTAFSHFPRTITLAWNPVSGARNYTVEIDCYHCCQNGKWCTEVGREWKIERNLTSTSYTFDFVGAQPGKWRVWASDADGHDGTKTGWREFVFTR